MAKNDPIEKLMVSLSEANEATLAALDERIDGKRREIDEATSKLRKEVSGLEALRKLIDIQVNGPKERKKPGKKRVLTEAEAEKDPRALGDDDMNKIYEFVAVNGPVQIVEISRATKIHHHTVRKGLKHEWFEETSAGFIIAKS